MFKNVNVFDGQKAHNNMHLWVKENKFAYFGNDESKLPTHADAEIEYDLTGRPDVWIMPGLVGKSFGFLSDNNKRGTVTSPSMILLISTFPSKSTR